MSIILQELTKTEFTLKEQAIIDPLPHFMPLWTSRVLDGLTDEELNITYGLANRCLVGEIHGMSRSYADDANLLERIMGKERKCDFCCKASYGGKHDNVGGFITAFEAQNNPKLFIKFKKQMYEHMAKSHKKEFKKLWLKK